MLQLYRYYSNLDGTAAILIAVAVMLLAAFLLTRLTKLLRLPNVTAYIVAGVLIGPFVLGLVSPEMVQNMGFVTDIALAFIAFGIGKFFKRETLKKTGLKVIVITLSQSLLAGLLVTLSVRAFFGLSWTFAMILGAIATATAPVSTMMTIHQYHARGEFVDILLQIIALDDVVCLLTFNIVTALVGGSASASQIVLPVLYNLGAAALGVLCGFLTGPFLQRRSKDNRLIIITAALIGIAGVCGALKVSPLLSCMLYGAVYINFTKDKELYKQINNFTPPIMALFFVVSGMSLDVRSIATAGLVGLTFFLVRMVGKYCGCFLSCLVTKQEPRIRNYMGFALFPSAGVAIGLAVLGRRILPAEMGTILMTVILSSSVLYEMIGPACAKFALVRSGCIDPERLRRHRHSRAERVIGANCEPFALVELKEAQEADRAERAASAREEQLSMLSPAPQDVAPVRPAEGVAGARRSQRAVTGAQDVAAGERSAEQSVPKPKT